MKNKYLYMAVTFAFTALLFFNACDKGNSRDNCAGIACIQALPVIYLDFVDSQGRDLFKPVTPNHLDSAKVVQLNSEIQFVRAGLATPNPSRRKMIIPWKSGEEVTFYLKLSDTDQDTIKYAQAVTKSCCANYQLTSFSYNGKAYTDSVARHYFTVVK